VGKLEYYLDLIKADDPVQIEMARDEVTRDDLGALAAAYWSLENWDQKGLLINLVQDYIDPRTRDIMIDFLKAPEDKSGDFTEVTKAIALCILEEDFERFTLYYDDRELLAQAVQRYLSGPIHSEQPPATPRDSSAPPPPTSPPSNSRKWWQFWKK